MSIDWFVYAHIACQLHYRIEFPTSKELKKILA